MYVWPCEANNKRCELEDLIYHSGTIDLNSEKTSSQIPRSVISLKTNNTIMIALITPQNSDLNNKGSKAKLVW